MKTERVREDESGDSEDCKDDELSCAVEGESARASSDEAQRKCSLSKKERLVTEA